MTYSIWNCHYTDRNGIKSMVPVHAPTSDDASIKFQLLAPHSKINRIAPDLRSARRHLLIGGDLA